MIGVAFLAFSAGGIAGLFGGDLMRKGFERKWYRMGFDAGLSKADQVLREEADKDAARKRIDDIRTIAKQGDI